MSYIHFSSSFSWYGLVIVGYWFYLPTKNINLFIHTAQVLACANGALRLQGGDEFSGRVEMCVGGQWGSMCSGIDWTDVTAQVVCRNLGFQDVSRMFVCNVIILTSR